MKRRQFLSGSLAVGAGLILGRGSTARAEPPTSDAQPPLTRRKETPSWPSNNPSSPTRSMPYIRSSHRNR